MTDKIVSTMYYEGTVLIFTERGIIYQAVRDVDGRLVFRLIFRLEFEP